MRKTILAVIILTLLFLSGLALGQDLNELELIVQLDKDVVELGDYLRADWWVEGIDDVNNTIMYDYVLSVIDGDLIEIVEEQYNLSGRADYNRSMSYGPSYGSKGIIEVTAHINNWYGDAVTPPISKAIEFEIQDPELTIDIYLENTSARLGENISVSWLAKGGIGPYRYNYSVQLVDSSVLGSPFNYINWDNTEKTSNDLNFSHGDKAIVRVSAVDTAWSARQASKEIELPLIGNILTLQTDLNKTTVEAGNPVMINWQPIGGIGPFIYDYSLTILEGAVSYEVDRDSYTSELAFTYTPMFGDKGVFTINAKDEAWESRTTSQHLEFDITGGLNETTPLLLTLKMTPDGPVTIKEGLVADWFITGGEPPFSIRHWWTTFHPGPAYLIRTYYTQLDITETVTINTDTGKSEGTSRLTPENKIDTGGEFNLIVTDNAGRKLEKRQGFVITERPAATPTPTLTPTPTPIPSPTPTITPTVTPIPAFKGDAGDATNDGIVDILDLVSIIDYIVSNTDPTSPTNADANGDGTVDILDLVWIIDQIVGV